MRLRVTERFLHLPRTVMEDQMQSCDWEEIVVLWTHFCCRGLEPWPESLSSCLMKVWRRWCPQLRWEKLWVNLVWGGGIVLLKFLFHVIHSTLTDAGVHALNFVVRPAPPWEMRFRCLRHHHMHFWMTNNINPLLNLLKPTGYVMHQQFNIQQLYALPTLYLCVSYLSENKQRLMPLTA